MKRIALAVMMCVAVGILGACGSSDPTSPSNQENPGTSNQGTSTKISAAQAKEMMDSSDPYILVDVRTADEYAGAHIDTAILIPVDDLASRAASELPDKDARILVYCQSGGRSARAAQTLVGLGYQQVFDMGGIKDWPYGTVSGR